MKTLQIKWPRQGKRVGSISTHRIKFWLGVVSVALASQSVARAQLTLTGTNYTQTFDGVGTALPTGFDVRTGATATSLGATTTFTTTATTWASTTAGFANTASADNLTSAATTTAQNASTDRVISLRQSGSVGDPGAAIDFNFNASSATFAGSGTALSLSLQMLDVQTRSTTFSIQYGTGSAPTSFTTLGTYADPGVFGSTPFTFTGTQLAALSGVSSVWLRIVALTTSGGTGSRDRIGLDDLILNYTASAAPTNNIYFDVNGTTAGSGVANGGSYLFSGPNFNSVLDGTGATATFTGGQTATFSAAADAGTSSYTVGIDTAVATNGLVFNSGNVTLANATNGSLTLSGAAISVGSATTATISQAIGGTMGLNKTDAGTLTLSGTNLYTGTTTVSGGILSVSADSNFGDAANGIVLGMGTLQTTASFSTARTLDGTGTLAVPSGTTLTLTGAVGGTTAGIITLSAPGTLALAGATGTAKTATVLNFSAPATVAVTGAPLVLSSGTNTITTTQAAGTATVSGPVNLGTGTRTMTVGDGSADVDLLLSGNLTGTTVLAKLGAGTLQLSGDNSGLTGTGTTPASVRIGTAGTAPVSGGTVSYTTATALGAGQVQFNGGVLRNDASGPLTVINSLSLGAQDLTPTPGGAVFSGQNTNFTGPVALFRATGTTNALQAITVNNTTTFSGTFATLTSAAGGGSGTSAGFTVGGTGTLVLSGNNTFTEPVNIAGTATLSAAGTGGNLSLGGATRININSGGTLQMGAANQFNATAPAAVFFTGAAGSVAAFKVAGFSQGSTTASGVGALTLTTGSSSNVLDFGGVSGVVTFTGFTANGGTLTINNYLDNVGAPGGSDQLIFQGDQVSNLGNFVFTGYGGATEQLISGMAGTSSAFYEVFPTPVPEPATVLGGMLMIGAAGWSQRRRLRSALLAA